MKNNIKYLLYIIILFYLLCSDTNENLTNLDKKKSNQSKTDKNQIEEEIEETEDETKVKKEKIIFSNKIILLETLWDSAQDMIL